jgi:4-amino-4-deoxy-L-arabinose transferase-like glycosyltransferase
MPSAPAGPAPKHAATRRFYAWLAFVAVLGLGVRLWCNAQLAASPFVASPPAFTDMATYRQLATAILEGHLPDSFYYQPLYYTLLLPPALALAGGETWGVGLLQALLAAGTIWLTGLGGARLFGRRAGLVAATLVAASRFHIFHTPYLLFEVPLGFLLALTLWSALRAWDRNTLRHWLWAGLALAAATLTRGNAILLLPALLALAAWRNRHQRWFASPLRLAILLAAVYLPQLPFAWHNYRALGRWTGPSTAGDAVLALGNTPEAPAGNLEYPTAYHEWMRQAALPGAQRVSVPSQIRNWLRKEPLAWPELKFRTALLFWHAMEIPNNMVFEEEAKNSPLLRHPLLLNFATIGALGVCGIFLSLGRLRGSPPRQFLLYALLVGGCLGTALFYMLGRFRLPWLPAFAIFAGHALERLLQLVESWKLRRNHLRPTLAFGAALLAAFYLVNYAYLHYCAWLQPWLLRHARPNGVAVDTPEGTHLHDHGPASLGGWCPLDLPREGLTISKSFRIPAAWQGRTVRPALILPILCQNPHPAILHLQVRLPDTPPIPLALNLQPMPQCQYLPIPLPPLRPGQLLPLELQFRPETSRQWLFRDTQRNYGRTQIFSPADPLAAGEGEFCLELLLAPPP